MFLAKLLKNRYRKHPTLSILIIKKNFFIFLDSLFPSAYFDSVYLSLSFMRESFLSCQVAYG